MNKPAERKWTPQNSSCENHYSICEFGQKSQNSGCAVGNGRSILLGLSTARECYGVDMSEPDICEQWLQSLLDGPLFERLQNNLIIPQNCSDIGKNTGCFCSILPACPNTLVMEYLKIYGEHGSQNHLLDYLVMRYNAMIK